MSDKSHSQKLNLTVLKLKNFVFLPKFLHEMKKLSIGGLSGGNKVSLLSDGDDCFDSFIGDIKKAKKSINLETFIFKSDEIGWIIANELVARAKSGVEINVIYDAVGSLSTSHSIFNYMQKNGIEIIEYHPIFPWRRFYNLIFRDHRKLLVIDGKIAYVGGINIGKDYAGKKYSGGNWRDTHLRIEGPAVKDVQFCFIENWYRHGGSVLKSELYFPELTSKGDTLLMIISTKSRNNVQPISESYFSAIKNAKKSIYITNAYFVPDRKIHHALVKASRRGVDVRLILPGKSDVQIVKYASRYLYNYYIRNGIKVYEYKNSILHAKTAVIDGVWSTIGSSNLDTRSLHANLELNAVILDNRFGINMEKVFKKDILSSINITKSLLKKRSVFQFLIEWICYRFKNLL